MKRLFETNLKGTEPPKDLQLGLLIRIRNKNNTTMNKVTVHNRGAKLSSQKSWHNSKKLFCIPQLNIQHVKTKIKYMSLQLKPIIEIWI